MKTLTTILLTLISIPAFACTAIITDNGNGTKQVCVYDDGKPVNNPPCCTLKQGDTTTCAVYICAPPFVTIETNEAMESMPTTDPVLGATIKEATK